MLNKYLKDELIIISQNWSFSRTKVPAEYLRIIENKAVLSGEQAQPSREGS